MKLRKLFFAVTAIAVMVVNFAQAADGTWTNNAAGNWSATGNWLGGTVANGADFTATLDNVITADRTITLDTARTIGNITVLDTDKNYTISGANTLTLDVTSGNPAINVPSGRTLTIGSVISGSDGLQKNGAGSLTLSGANTYSGGTVINAGIISVTSNGNLGDSTGSITLDGGKLTLASVNISCARSVVVGSGGGSISVNGNNNFTTSGKLTGSGTLTHGPVGGSGGQTLNFNATDNDFTGEIRFLSNSPTISFNSLADSANSIIFNGSQGGTFTWNTGAIAPLVLIDRAFELAGTAAGQTYKINNANTTAGNSITIVKDLLNTTAYTKILSLAGANAGTNTFAGTIPDASGAALSLTKVDGGKWILSGTNTYSGGTTVSAGTLTAAAVSELGFGNVTVSGTTTLLVIDVSGAMTNTASLYLPSATTKNLTLNADLYVSKLFIAGVEYPAGTYTSSGAGSAWMNAGSGALIVGPAAVQPVFWDLNGSTSGSGGATPAGTWDGVNTYWNSLFDGTGSVGAWTAGRTAAFAAGTDATGTYTVTVSGTQDIGGLTFEEGTVTLSGGTALRLVSDAVAYVAASRSATIETPFTQDATPRQLTKGGTGTLTLSADSSHSGGTVLGAGTLILNANGALGTGPLVLSSGTIQNNDASERTLNNTVVLNGNSTIGGTGNLTFSDPGAGAVAAASTLTVNSGLNASIASAMGGSGALTKAGAGTLTLTGTNTYSGATTVSAGRLVVDGGQIANNAAVSVNGGNSTMVITNGANIFSGSACAIGNNNANNNVLVVGGNGVTSLWDLGNQNLKFTGVPGPNGLVIDGAGVAGSAVVTNLAVLEQGRSAANSSILLTNGAQMFVNGQVQIGSTYYNSAGTNNSITIVGGAADSTFYGSNNSFYVGYGDRPDTAYNQVVVGAGGVMTNVGYNASTPETDFVVGWAQTGSGTGSAYSNQLVVNDGGKVFAARNLTVGWASGNNSYTRSNALLIANGGMVNAPGALYLGVSVTGTGLTLGGFNGLAITSGGQLFTGADSIIGYAKASGQTNISNTAWIGGTSSLWDLGGKKLFIGSTVGTGVATGNAVSVSDGGVVTNISALIVKAANTLSLGAGGAIYANAVTNSGTLAVTIDGGEAPACGTLNVSGNLNVTGATLDVTVAQNPTTPCVIATYGTLTGGFAVTNGLDENFTLEMNYKGENKIAILYAAAGTLIQLK